MKREQIEMNRIRKKQNSLLLKNQLLKEKILKSMYFSTVLLLPITCLIMAIFWLALSKTLFQDTGPCGVTM
jgi:predicted RND superfamily exporter protein